MRSALQLLFVLIVLVCTSCKEKTQEVFLVKGTVRNLDKILKQFPDLAPNDTVKLVLFEVPFGAETNPIQLDTAFVTAAKSDFELQGQIKGTTIYDVMIEKGPAIPIVNDTKELTLDIDLLNREKYYSVTGSPASEKLNEFLFAYNDRTVRANAAFTRLDSLKLRQANDSLILAATNDKNNSLAAVNNYVKNFLASTDNSTLAAFVLGTAANTFPEPEFEAVLNKMVQKYPADSNLTMLKAQLDNRKAAIAAQSAARKSWVGKSAPELTLPDASGKEIALSSFKGKYVLVDFWASWCRPCRIENPNVVNAFNQFKDRNFTILGVSLDREKDNWLQAIKDDNLSWTHVSDLAFWNSKAVDVFGFEGIPYNVLINPEGIVIAEDLRGNDLPARLQQELK